MPTFESQPGAIYDPSHYDPQCEPNHFGGGNAVANLFDQWSWPSYPAAYPFVDPVHEAPFIDPGSYALGTYGSPQIEGPPG